MLKEREKKKAKNQEVPQKVKDSKWLVNGNEIDAAKKNLINNNNNKMEDNVEVEVEETMDTTNSVAAVKPKTTNPELKDLFALKFK